MPNATGNYDVNLDDVIEAGTDEPDEDATMASVRGDSDTVFVVLEADGDVSTYTGIANAPDVSTGTSVVGGDTNEARITAVVNTSNGYAEYVFVDLSSDADARVKDSNTAADYLFLLNPTGNRTTDSNNETYFRYDVVYDGTEMEKYVESSIGVNDAGGDLYIDVKENSNGWVTDAEPFNGDDADKDVLDLGGSGTIVYRGNTLTIDGTNDGEYIVNDNTNVVLAIDGVAANVTADLVDQGDDYELYLTSARNAAAVLDNCTLNGTVYVALDDDNSEVATDIYIWISSATRTETPDSGEDDDEDNSFDSSVGIAKNGMATIEISNFVWSDPADGEPPYESATITFDLKDEDGLIVNETPLTIELDAGETRGSTRLSVEGYASGDKLTIANAAVSYTPVETLPFAVSLKGGFNNTDNWQLAEGYDIPKTVWAGQTVAVYVEYIGAGNVTQVGEKWTASVAGCNGEESHTLTITKAETEENFTCYVTFEVTSLNEGAEKVEVTFNA